MISEYCIYYQNSRRALTFIYLKSVQPNLVMLWLPGIKNTVKQQIPSIFILMNRRECVKIPCNKFFEYSFICCRTCLDCPLISSYLFVSVSINPYRSSVAVSVGILLNAQ